MKRQRFHKNAFVGSSKRQSLSFYFLVFIFWIYSLQFAHSQALPEHLVQYDVETGRCSIKFLPDETTGASPPQLQLTVDMITELVSFQLSGGIYTSQIFLWGDSRSTFNPIWNATSQVLRQNPLWISMEDAQSQSAPIFWTVQQNDGDYSSARYDDLTTGQIARTLAIGCKFYDLDPITPTLVEAKLAEDRLDLTLDQIRHIKGVLTSAYGEPGTQPSTSSGWTITDRRLIGLYNQDREQNLGEYLSEAAVAELLALEPSLQSDIQGFRKTATAAFTNWSVYLEESDGICSIETAATTASGYPINIIPIMRLSIARSDTGGLMAFDLAQPNNFEPSASIRAVIDGRPIELMVETSGGALVPRPLPDGRLSNEFTTRLRRGNEIMIEGTAMDTGGPIRLKYSAQGFTAAFREMSSLCERPAVLGWIQ